MKRFRRSAFLFLLAVAPATARAQATATAYGVEKGSRYEAGCLGPCACPVFFSDSLRGAFTLVPGAFDGLYQHYAVVDVDWTVPSGGWGGGLVRLRGSGTYQVGGEFAVQHWMILNLAANGQPLDRFDSGLVPGGGEFPRIEITVPPFEYDCFDTLFRLVAAPAAPLAVDAGRALTSLRVLPNPSVRSLEVELALSRRAPVDVRVVDLAGRSIRVLAGGEWMEAGTRRLAWDGRRDDATTAPAGLYFVRTRVAGEAASRAAIRLR